MSNPPEPDDQDREQVHVRPGGSPPGMPAIRAHERQPGSPYLLVDGTGRIIGWRWHPPAKGDPEFVIATRTAMGGLKILEHFPLTEEGWTAAWQSLGRDPVAAAKVTARLAARAAQDAKDGVRPPPLVPEPMLIVTTNEIPGHVITQVHGDVFGITVRAQNYFGSIGASWRTVVGGEVAGYTKLLTESRNQARERMWHEARSRGANAVVAMRFDCNEIGDVMSEVAAYGTAVTVEPVTVEPVGPA